MINKKKIASKEASMLKSMEFCGSYFLVSLLDAIKQ